MLADVGMPERDGYEVAAFIKGDPELAHIPVLLLTGAFEPIDEARARAVGCDGVLVKPFEPQMVISRVRDLLAGNRRRSHPSRRRSGRRAARAAPAPADQPAGRRAGLARRLLRSARRGAGQQERAAARRALDPGAADAGGRRRRAAAAAPAPVDARRRGPIARVDARATWT